MGNIIKCPICGCENIGQGKLSGYTNMNIINNHFSIGSEVVAEICTKCGQILSLRINNPDKFKDLESS